MDTIYDSINDKHVASAKRKAFNKTLILIRDTNPKRRGILALVDLRFSIKQAYGLV